MRTNGDVKTETNKGKNSHRTRRGTRGNQHVTFHHRLVFLGVTFESPNIEKEWSIEND